MIQIAVGMADHGAAERVRDRLDLDRDVGDAVRDQETLDEGPDDRALRGHQHGEIADAGEVELPVFEQRVALAHGEHHPLGVEMREVQPLHLLGRRETADHEVELAEPQLLE